MYYLSTWLRVDPFFYRKVNTADTIDMLLLTFSIILYAQKIAEIIIDYKKTCQEKK